MRVLGPFAVGLLGLAISLMNSSVGRPPHEDAGIFTYAASRWLAGGLPYVSVWDDKPPGIYAFAALGLLVGDGSFDGVWLLETVAVVSAAILGYVAMRRALSAEAAMFGSAAWLLAAPGLFVAPGRSTLFPELVGLPFQFGALFLISARPGRARDLAIGILGSCALLLKPTLIGVWIAIAVWTIVARRAGARPTLARITLAAAGPLVATGAYFAARGGLGDLWDQVVTYNLAYGGVATLADRVGVAYRGFQILAETGLTFALVLVWPAAALRARRADPHPLLAVAALAFPLDVALSASTGRPYAYYYLSWLPAASILLAFSWQAASRAIGLRVVRLAMPAVMLLMSIVPALIAARAGEVDNTATVRPVVEVILARTDPTDNVFIWGNDTEVLVLSQRIAPTRFVSQYAPLFTPHYPGAERTEQLLSDLESAPPALIIDGSALPSAYGGTPSLDREAMRSSTPDGRYVPPPEIERIAAFVAERYQRLDLLIGSGWVVYARR